MNTENIDIDAERVIAILREENPIVLELAVRRAIIEQQGAALAAFHAATTNGNGAEVLA